MKNILYLFLFLPFLSSCQSVTPVYGDWAYHGNLTVTGAQSSSNELKVDSGLEAICMSPDNQQDGALFYSYTPKDSFFNINSTRGISFSSTRDNFFWEWPRTQPTAGQVPMFDTLMYGFLARLKWAVPSGGGGGSIDTFDFWNIHGNAGTNPLIDFIGPTDRDTLYISVGGDVVGFFDEASGAYGIGKVALSGNTGTLANAIGGNAGQNNSGSHVEFMGRNAGANNTGNEVVAIGESAGYGNTGNDVELLWSYDNHVSGNSHNEVTLLGTGAYANKDSQFVISDNRVSLKMPLNNGATGSVLTYNAADSTAKWGTAKLPHTVQSAAASDSVTLTNNATNIVNPTGSLPAFTVKLPRNPNDNDRVEIIYTGLTGAVSYYAYGRTVTFVPPSSSVMVTLVYDSNTKTWY